LTSISHFSNTEILEFAGMVGCSGISLTQILLLKLF